MTSTSSTSATAWRYHKRGILPVTLKKEDVPVRALKADEVLIKVHAAALNPVDWKIASIMPSFINKVPHTAAADFAGEVVSVKAGSESQKRQWLATGTRVFGIVPAEETMKTGEGALSTYLIAKPSLLSPIPSTMSYEEASGITLTGLTAATLASSVKSGDRVLILGGTTSVGLLLIQMCKAEGASLVVATASTEKISAVIKAGAHKVIDYRKDDVEATLKAEYGSDPFDYILDCVGAFDTYYASPGYLKQKGAYLNVGASSLDITRLRASVLDYVKNTISTLLLPSWLGGTPRKYSVIGLDAKYMDKLSNYVSSGKVQPKVDSIFKFDEAPKAYEHLIKGRALGKVVVSVASD